jgi:hypothetical protein
MAAPAASSSADADAALALFVPASTSEPLRLVPLPGYDDSADDYRAAAERNRDATRAYVGDAISGLYDTFILARDEAGDAATTLVACVPDDRRGQRRNAWWHAAGAGLPEHEVHGPLLLVAERTEGYTTRALSLTSWRNARSRRTHGAEEWVDASGAALLRQLRERLVRTDEQRAANARDAFAFMSDVAGRPPTVLRMDTPTMEARVCAACRAADKPLRKCAACSTVLYCGRECQRAHWAQHKMQCRSARPSEREAA